MKENCLDIGMVQAFMDGELPYDQIARVTDHLDRCDSCAMLAAQAEDEAAFVFSTLDREFNSLVPTQRLWNKINDSIEVQRRNRPFWHKAQAFLAVAFGNPSMVAAAGLLLAVGAFSILLINNEPNQQNIATLPGPIGYSAAPSQPITKPVPVESPSTVDRENAARYQVEFAVNQPKATPKRSKVARERVVTALSNGYLDGEESYVKTISSLSLTVEEQKDVLRPSERVAYERDMAIVNDTISKVRRELKKNPRNESAKQVLYASYQNKIDLLNSVSQKEELVASLR